jgi:zinc transporter ZupT
MGDAELLLAVLLGLRISLGGLVVSRVLVATVVVVVLEVLLGIVLDVDLVVGAVVDTLDWHFDRHGG